MSKKLIYILSGIAIALILVVVIGKNKFGNRNVLKVAVSNIEKRDLTETVSCNGKLNPIELVNLSIEVSGEVTKITYKKAIR